MVLLQGEAATNNISLVSPTMRDLSIQTKSSNRYRALFFCLKHCDSFLEWFVRSLPRLRSSFLISNVLCVFKALLIAIARSVFTWWSGEKGF